MAHATVSQETPQWHAQAATTQAAMQQAAAQQTAMTQAAMQQAAAQQAMMQAIIPPVPQGLHHSGSPLIYLEFDQSGSLGDRC